MLISKNTVNSRWYVAQPFADISLCANQASLRICSCRLFRHHNKYISVFLISMDMAIENPEY